MIKKLLNLIKRYDEIMKVLDFYNQPVKNAEPKKENKKAYSTFNTPLDQLKYIEKIEKGEK